MKRRILLGLLPLVIVLMVVGCYAIALFFRLGGAIDVILRENYRSVVAAQNMQEAIERMDSGLLFTLAGEEEKGRLLYAENLPVFRENLRAEQANITLPGEAELVSELEGLAERYTAEAEVFLALETVGRRRIYFDVLQPVFGEIKQTAREVLQLNQESMVRADREARRIAEESARYMAIAIVLGGGAVVFLAWRLQAAILRPIREVTMAVRELGEGNYDQVVPASTRDELGEMVQAFNKMAGRLRVYRQMTDEKLVQARQTAETIFSALPDPVFVLSGSGGVEFQNPAAAQLLQRLEGQHLPYPVQAAAERVRQGAADILPESLAEVLCVRVEEREMFLLPRVVGLHDEGGGSAGAAVILQDVTRFRLLDDVKTNLVSTVSHELKTPLTSVRMGLHLLLEERIGALNPAQVELLIAARDDSERLLQMINDLLDLARLESGGAQFALQAIPVAELLESAVRDAQAQAEQRGLRVAWDVAPGLPAVMAEPLRIAHVFSNLISNAVKHSPPGSEIVLGARGAGGDAVRFSVSDAGPGIAREHQARIFERFFRAPGAAKGGAGLGLAIAREIVIAHGGHVGVESELGKGSEFYFVLPAEGASGSLRGFGGGG